MIDIEETTLKNIFSESVENKFINEIYLYIGACTMILIVLYCVIKMIKKCQKKEQNTQSTTPIISVTSIRRNSSVRNSLVPIRRTSLDVRFLMETRARRNGIYTHLFSNNEYANIIDESIHWNGTRYLKQELFHTNDTLKDTLVIVKQQTTCDCKTIQAKIIDSQTMLLENLETGTYFYADKYSIEYKYKRPSHNGVTLMIYFDDTTTYYNGTLSYLIKSITWLPNYELSMTNIDFCHLRGDALIRNHQQQEYEVHNTYLYSGDIQLIKNPSLSILPKTNSSIKSIEFNSEQKGFYSYSFKTPYHLRAYSSVRLPFLNIIPQCQFSYKATVNIHHGQYKGIFSRQYSFISNQFLPAGIVTIRDNQILIGQSNLPDVPENSTQSISLGHDYDVRYSINSNLLSSDELETKGRSRTYDVSIMLSNLKKKEIYTHFELHGLTRLILHESTCLSGRIDGKMYILSIVLRQGENYQCQLNLTMQ
ncbi:hypothetical protein I4U23_009955 [Adineta vaga]|nr:hypothetical protein I4U23_009955 [Adineta vaga]